MITIGIYGSFDWESHKSYNENGEPTWCHDAEQHSLLMVNMSVVSQKND